MISIRWFNFGTLDFYRHTVWGFQNIKSVDDYELYLFIYGGLHGDTSKLNQDFLRIDVIELFSSIEILNNELDEYINNVINMEIEKSKKLNRVKTEPKNIFVLKDTVVMTKIDEINDINNNVKNLSINELTEESRRMFEGRKNGNSRLKNRNSGSQSMANLNVNGLLAKNTLKAENKSSGGQTHSPSEGSVSLKDNKSSNNSVDDKLLKEFLDFMPLAENFKPLNLEKNVKLLKKESIIKLLKIVKEELIKTPSLINLQYPIKIFGSLNGQYNDLINFFNTFGRPHEYKGDIDSFEYLFLGNIINRGTFSLEVVCLIFALKVKMCF